MDRGYGNLAAQQRLWEEDGIYSNSIMQDNRKGLPRRWLADVKKDLTSCPKQCQHREGDSECRKFMWSVMNKPPFELNDCVARFQADNIVWKLLLLHTRRFTSPRYQGIKGFLLSLDT